MPKLSVSVSQELNAIIAQKAVENGQSKTEWIEKQIVATLSDTPSADQRIIDAVALRCDQVEARIFHENSVVLHLLFETFREAIHASTAGMSAASRPAPDDDAEADELGRSLYRDAEGQFTRRRESLIAMLKGMRDEAKAKAKAVGRSLDLSANDDKEVH